MPCNIVRKLILVDFFVDLIPIFLDNFFYETAKFFKTIWVGPFHIKMLWGENWPIFSIWASLTGVLHPNVPMFKNNMAKV